MEISRDVILDLLSLVDAGEASADSKALVEHHLAGDPELARIARERLAPVVRCSNVFAHG